MLPQSVMKGAGFSEAISMQVMESLEEDKGVLNGLAFTIMEHSIVKESLLKSWDRVTIHIMKYLTLEASNLAKCSRRSSWLQNQLVEKNKIEDYVDSSEEDKEEINISKIIDLGKSSEDIELRFLGRILARILWNLQCVGGIEMPSQNFKWSGRSPNEYLFMHQPSFPRDNQLLKRSCQQIEGTEFKKPPAIND
eukprot:Gb_37357 [translate_table: standard]